MPSYKYSAANDDGRKISGSIVADNPLDLEMRLKNIGLDLMDYRQEKIKKGGGKIKMQDLIVFCLHLEQLDRAGVPINDALADVRDATENPRLKDVITGLYESLRAGQLLSEAMANYPEVFDNVFIGLVQTGEKTGNLDESFRHIADHYKWVHGLNKKVKKAMSYPIFLLGVMVIVISVLMIFVVPKLITFITTQGFDIPFHTKALIWVSGAFAESWYLILGLPIAVLTTGIYMYKTSDNFAYMIDDIILGLPIIGDVVRKINLARFTEFFSLMYRSGIDIVDALEMSSNVIKNRVIKESVKIVRKSVIEGSGITDALKLSNQFPGLVIRMFKVAEESGNMNESLQNINFFYEKEVNDSVDSMVGSIQPALTIIMGALILWVVSSVFGPLYDTFSKMDF